MTTTYTDIEAEISLFTKQMGYRPSEYKITAIQFIEVLQDAYSFRRGGLIGAVPPEFDKIGFGPTVVRAVNSIGITLYIWSDILAEYGRQYAICNPTSHLGGFLQLDIGPWSYPVPLPLQNWGSHQTTSSMDNMRAVPDSHPPTTMREAGEPACLCSSRALVTVGHEQGCRWLLWRRSNG